MLWKRYVSYRTLRKRYGVLQNVTVHYRALRDVTGRYRSITELLRNATEPLRKISILPITAQPLPRKFLDLKNGELLCILGAIIYRLVPPEN